MRRCPKTANVGDQNSQPEDRQQGAGHQMPDPALLIRAVAEEFVTQINAQSAGDGHEDVPRAWLHIASSWQLVGQSRWP
jgi:hypothetical protein